jgi:hypothetical protein
MHVHVHVITKVLVMHMYVKVDQTSSNRLNIEKTMKTFQENSTEMICAEKV